MTSPITAEPKQKTFVCLRDDNHRVMGTRYASTLRATNWMSCRITYVPTRLTEDPNNTGGACRKGQRKKTVTHLATIGRKAIVTDDGVL